MFIGIFPCIKDSVYIDDGYSGTNFNRPAFQRMIEDIEAGKVNTVCTKDLSRFGREHVMMDYYLEFYFPEKKQTVEIRKAENRKEELDRLFAKLYEDWSANRINEYNFNMLTQKYQSEQEEIDEKIKAIRLELNTEKQTAEDARKWIELIKKNTDPTELTADLLNTLIEKIVVHDAAEDEFGFRTQEIEIYYRFVGKIDE